MASSARLDFADFARHSRPASWTWFDVLVARGPISADGFANAMQYAFEESKHVNALLLIIFPPSRTAFFTLTANIYVPRGFLKSTFKTSPSGQDRRPSASNSWPPA